MGLLLGGLRLGWMICIENTILVFELLATGKVVLPDIALDPAYEI